jgi:hypothetical protein
MFIPSLFYPFILSAFTVYSTITGNMNKFLEKAYTAYQIAFAPKVYVFCKGYSQPVLYNNMIPLCQQHLFYDTDKSLFYTQLYSDYKKYSLPILSIEIIHNDNVVADLTNFIEEMRFVNVGSTPSITNIIMLWATVTNNYLNPETHRVRYIDAVGDSFEYGLTESNAPLHVS